MSASLRLLCLNLVSQVHLPDLLGPVVPGVPAGTLQGTVQSIVQEIPVAGAVSRIAYAAVPAVPAGAHIPIRIEQVPVMIDHAPLVRRITAVWPPVPMTDPGTDPARGRRPGPHERLRAAVGLDQLCGCAAPVRQVQMGLVHQAGPIAAPGQAQGLGNSCSAAEEASAIIIAVVAGLAVAVHVYHQVEVKGNTPLVLRSVGCAPGIGYDLAGLGTALGIECFLLLNRSQRLTDSYNDSLGGTGLDPLGRQLLQAGMA